MVIKDAFSETFLINTDLHTRTKSQVSLTQCCDRLSENQFTFNKVGS